MQGMLDNLSQPVAFATVPLGNAEPPASGARTPPIPKKDASLSSDTDSAEEAMFSRLTRRIGIGRDGKKASRKSTLSVATSSGDDDFDEGLFDEESLGDELSESFFVIPSGNEPSPAALKKENAALKLEAETLKKRLETTERVLQLRKEQDSQLRDSIFQATREAQRAMGASMVGQRTGGLDMSSLNLNVPGIAIPGINSGREAQYARRVKELEEEIRGVKAENEKHKAMIAKFRERWEKLKESAKRKKEAKAAAAAASSSTREKIVEEPEAEEELDGTGA
ncbi:hypothetical protein DXG03_007281 [Asterophora parasitica]|uniref:Uncharacterized protein n=1 Tax=Asterophora parasitica TaxID=117018 RepID=A0A9P7G8S7_9AGAR|nr:hypothetical protein DXG03_007281 [Asterophora parasitica]